MVRGSKGAFLRVVRLYESPRVIRTVSLSDVVSIGR